MYLITNVLDDSVVAIFSVYPVIVWFRYDTNFSSF